MLFASALQLVPGVTALIGSGGKTSLMLRLASELKQPVILCTTTHIRRPEGLPCLYDADESEISAALRRCGTVVVGTPAEDGKLTAPRLAIERLAALAAYVLVEADGARCLPVKAHLPHEPVIPPCSTQTVAVFGLSGLGRPIRDAAHRPELYAANLGVSPDALLTPALAAAHLTFEHLHTRVFLNQADGEAERAAGKQLATMLTCPVCMGSLQKGTVECLY